MKNAHTHPIDAQLSLSMLFLALAEGIKPDAERATLRGGEVSRREREVPYEEPQRWDGLW
jgi:hypothetical protein